MNEAAEDTESRRALDSTLEPPGPCTSTPQVMTKASNKDPGTTPDMAQVGVLLLGFRSEGGSTGAFATQLMCIKV